MGGRCLGGRLEEGWIGKRDAAMHDYKGTLREERRVVEMGFVIYLSNAYTWNCGKIIVTIQNTI